MGKQYMTILIIAPFVIRAIDGANESFTTSQAPKLELQKSAGSFQDLFRQHLSSLRQGGPKHGPPIKQYQGVPAALDEFLKQRQQGSDTFLEPYWPKSEWVYNRKTATAKPPLYLALYPKVKPEFLDNCTEICPRIFESYGPVCGHHVYMWSGMMKVKQFHNLCHMYFDNCIRSRTSRYNDAWQPMFQGRCHNRWKAFPWHDGHIVTNTNKHIKPWLLNMEEPGLINL